MAIYALVSSWVCIIIYLWVRFQGVAFGLAAVVALIHDVFVMLGAIAISIYVAPFLGFLMVEPFKINLPIVAAFLTIIGYSVNDTIVVFDRIREVRGKDPSLTRKMVNDSTNQTLSRTLLTSFTVFLVVMVLYFFGGEAMHGFAFALIVGVATGTYSSIYVAAPILLWLVGKHKEQGGIARVVPRPSWNDGCHGCLSTRAPALADKLPVAPEHVGGYSAALMSRSFNPESAAAFPAGQLRPSRRRETRLAWTRADAASSPNSSHLADPSPASASPAAATRPSATRR